VQVVINIKVNKETHPGSFRWRSITVAPPEEGMSVISGSLPHCGTGSPKKGMSVTSGDQHQGEG
jgi:hypothetical protein